MKTYTVLYAEDVPHYAHGEIEARSPKDAIAKARKLDTDTFGAYDADWNNAVCRRIVSIQDEAGNDIACDVSLDDYHLMRGTDQDRRTWDAAQAMLDALETLIAKADDLIAAIEGATDQFEPEVAELSAATSAAQRSITSKQRRAA